MGCGGPFSNRATFLDTTRGGYAAAAVNIELVGCDSGLSSAPDAVVEADLLVPAVVVEVEVEVEMEESS